MGKTHDVTELFADDLRDPVFAAEYLSQALELANDEQRVKRLRRALLNIAKAHGVTNVAAQIGINRQTFYKDQDMRIGTVLKLLRVFGIEFSARQSSQSTR